MYLVRTEPCPDCKGTKFTEWRSEGDLTCMVRGSSYLAGEQWPGTITIGPHIALFCLLVSVLRILRISIKILSNNRAPVTYARCSSAGLLWSSI